MDFWHLLEQSDCEKNTCVVCHLQAASNHIRWACFDYGQRVPLLICILHTDVICGIKEEVGNVSYQFSFMPVFILLLWILLPFVCVWVCVC